MACAACRGEIERFRETLALIDRARLAEMATVPEPGDWTDLRSELMAARRQSSIWRAPLLKAAAIVLVAGATFLLGRYWDRLGSAGGSAAALPAGAVTPDASAALLDPQMRLTRFVSQTDGYLRKSHLVLLEFANGDAAQDPAGLKQVSSALAKETRKAEQIAAQLADPRIQGLVARLGAALGAVAALDSADPEARDHARRLINESGVLEELEILDTVATMERTRT